jgi:biotin/methionine sulfoxide reductase
MALSQTASHWGTYAVEVEGGDVRGVRPFASDGDPSPLIAALPHLLRHALRIDRPHVREGYLRRRGASRMQRGEEPFVPVSWDAALGLVEKEVRRVRAEYGNTAIYGGSYGWASAGRLHHAPSLLKRFLGMAGGYVDKLGNHSFGAAMHILPYVIGRSDVSRLAVPWPTIVAETRLVVMFGGANLKNAQIDSGGLAVHESADWFRRAEAAGVAFVNISPLRDDAAHLAGAEWLALRPNTDMAVMLGLAHTLIVEELHDRAFLASHCVGFDAFADYVLGLTDNQPKSAEWAAAISEIPANVIRALARRMAATRTLVTMSWSVQRADHGEQPVWMAVVLAAMLGQIGLPGGGFGFGLAAMSSIASPTPSNIPRPTLPLGRNSVTSHVPVGRVTDMLLHPGERLDYNGRTITFPDIRLIYSAGGNPFHHNTNLNRFVRAWKRPETVIVHEPWWSPAAKFADIVLPCTTTLERNDIQASELSPYWIAMRQAVPPVGNSRNDYDIFAELAGRLRFADAFTEGRGEMEWLAHIYDEARQRAVMRGYTPPPFSQFWDEGACRFEAQTPAASLFSAFRADPAAHPLRTASGRIEITSGTLAAFAYEDCPGQPRWMDPAEWLGAAESARYPLHLISNQPRTRLHSQLDPAPISCAAKVAGREPLTMHPSDAQARGLSTGMVVRVFNARGAFLAGLTISDAIRPGVVQIATGAWYDPVTPGEAGALEKHGNPNVVTGDKGTSKLGQSSVAQTVLVEIEAARDVPEVTAHALPPVVVLKEGEADKLARSALDDLMI